MAEPTSYIPHEFRNNVLAILKTYNIPEELLPSSVLLDSDFTSNGILVRTSEGVYGVVSDNSSNWNTAYGWGNHADAGYAASGHTHIGLISGLNANYLAKASDVNTITDSILYETSSKIVLGGTVPRATFDVIGTQVIGLLNTISSPSGKSLEIAGEINLAPVIAPTTTDISNLTLTAVENGNLLPNTTYYYGIAYVTAIGDTEAGYQGTGWRKTITTGANPGGYKIQIDNLPIATDPRVTGRKIYRATSSGGVGKRVILINNNTQTSYLDNIIEASLITTDLEYRKDNTTLKGFYYKNANAFRIGQWNLGLAYNVMANLTTGYENIVIGINNVGNALTTGNTNTFIGSSAGSTITTGNNNIAMGYASLMYQNASAQDVAIGNGALRAENSSTTKTISYCTAVGNNALAGIYNSSHGNAAYGYNAGTNLSGAYNVFVGYHAGYSATAKTSFNYNILIGNNVGATLLTGARNILIGSGVDVPASTTNNWLNIGNVLYGLNTAIGSSPSATSKIGIRTASPTAPLSINEKAAINEYGGYMIKLTNKTGGASVKGEVVSIYSATAVDNAVKKIVVDVPDPIGVFYESGVADGSEAWIVVSGIADVYFIGDTTRGYLARGFVSADSGYVSGQAMAEAVPTSPFATDKHFYEIGHVLESRTGAGLAKCVLHFN